MAARIIKVVPLEMASFTSQEGSASHSSMVQWPQSSRNAEHQPLLPFLSRSANQDHRHSLPSGLTQDWPLAVLLLLLAVDIFLGIKPLGNGWKYQGIRDTIAHMVWRQLLVSRQPVYVNTS